jgi:inorganic pyrophosphatase
VPFGSYPPVIHSHWDEKGTYPRLYAHTYPQPGCCIGSQTGGSTLRKDIIRKKQDSSRMVYPFEALPVRPADLSSADFQVYAIIEQAYGTKERTTWDRTSHTFIKTGLFMEQSMPVPYGWIPQTRNPSDGDALDVLIVTDKHLHMPQGSFLIARPVGVLLRHDQDHKILAVDVEDARFGLIHDYTELAPDLLTPIEDWFRRFFILDGWADAAAARRMIEQAHNAFAERPSADTTL